MLRLGSTPSKVVEYGWNIVEFLLENGWKMVGNGRNMVGILLEYGWKMVGKWLENKVYTRWVPHLVNVGYKDSTPCKCGGWDPHPVNWFRRRASHPSW